MSIIKNAPRKIWSFLNVINAVVPKNRRKIFIYSNLGFRDNVKAIYDYLIKNGYNKKYRIICALNDYKKQKPCENVRFMGCFRGIFSFFSCQYAFYCFGKYPIKPRRGQTVVNLWHGMPLKRIGNMLPGFENTDYNYFTHILCTSEFFRDIMKRSFNCSDDQIFICGQPRTDIMLESANDTVRGKKLLLWLPTYRDGNSEIEILSPEQLETLNGLCKKYGWQVLIKLHPLSNMTVSEFSEYRRENIKIIDNNEFECSGMDLYTLLKQSDCLITDYSSVFFDYLLLDRPIGFAVEDIEDYSSERGFTIEDPCGFMPGEFFSDGKGMLEFIESVFEGKDRYREKRKKYNDIFNKFQDSENCRRIIETFIGERL